ncbi:MAG: D-alanyl-D-alanine carboxypeptidase/D-alanyl-D-alanine-endopeptidase [Chlorobi bacterium]|nr:D-alanyl-D-alanine carboxypeptidase/D-alanyl-D-alanine-endopeptidase [Chlorobiota bacterium]
MNFFFKILLVALFVSAQLTAQVSFVKAKKKIELLGKEKFFESALLAVSAYDLTARKTIVNLNSKKLLHPASNEKLITTAAALLYLGEDYSFKTSFYYSGFLKDSVCYGDLYVKGGGDPDLTIDELDSLVTEIKSAGIRAVTGSLYGDVSLFDSTYWGEGWMWDDEPGISAPFLTPLIVNGAGIRIYYAPTAVNAPPKITLEPDVDFFSIDNRALTVDADTSDLTITRGWMSHSNNIIIEGTLSKNSGIGYEEISLFKPGFFFLSLMRESLEKNGIAFGGITDTATLPQNAVEIFTFSRPLKNVLPNMNKESDNLSAEAVFLQLGYAKYGAPANAGKSVKVIEELITQIGLNPKDYRIADGSGLSHYNLVSTELMLNLLTYLYLNKPEEYETFYNSLAIGGVDGTLSARMFAKEILGNVRAKTGTLSGISTLSGYLTTQGNHKIAFSIFIQNFVEQYGAARSYQDRICKILSLMK